jgi:DNA-binding LytR/AlgR family response regulator
MEIFNCLIVDDEPIARDIVAAYCAHLPQLKVVGSSPNALKAKQVLQEQKVDILFLDINMPVLDGIAFLKTLKYKPQVILTTAYKEYALDAFDLAACDYLLKPFSLERFIMAVDKATERLGDPKKLMMAEDISTENYLFIKADSKIYKVMHDDLLYAEASGNHTRIILGSQTLQPSMTFSALEEQLPKSRFIRIHRSFIINKSKISHIEGNRVFIGRQEVPIGSNYREVFLQQIGL